MKETEVHPVCIVMIEDDEGHARLIERNIRRAGVNNDILPFTSGSAALDYLMGPDGSGEVSAKRHLLVLLDLNLPDMTGIDILQKIKENQHTKRSPVVVLTSKSNVSVWAARPAARVSRAKVPRRGSKVVRMRSDIPTIMLPSQE